MFHYKRISVLSSILILYLTGLFSTHSNAKDTENKIIKNINYLNITNPTKQQQKHCKLDLYLPGNKFKDFPVVIHFHGGGLKVGSRGGPVEFTKDGIAVIAAGYRLYPKASCPEYLDDSAAAVAWAFQNIEKYGGNPEKIFISGYSAGGYLAAMVAMDKSYLKKYGVDADKLCGLIPRAGQMLTHASIRKFEHNLGRCNGLSDKYAPLFHVRKTPFPIYIQCGDDDMPGRQEENQLFAAMLKGWAKQKPENIIYHEFPGNHGTFWPKGMKDFKQFILEKSGIVKPSGRFKAGK